MKLNNILSVKIQPIRMQTSHICVSLLLIHLQHHKSVYPCLYIPLYLHLNSTDLQSSSNIFYPKSFNKYTLVLSLLVPSFIKPHQVSSECFLLHAGFQYGSQYKSQYKINDSTMARYHLLSQPIPLGSYHSQTH